MIEPPLYRQKSSRRRAGGPSALTVAQPWRRQNSGLSYPPSSMKLLNSLLVISREASSNDATAYIPDGADFRCRMQISRLRGRSLLCRRRMRINLRRNRSEMFVGRYGGGTGLTGTCLMSTSILMLLFVMNSISTSGSRTYRIQYPDAARTNVVLIDIGPGMRKRNYHRRAAQPRFCRQCGLSDGVVIGVER